MIPIIIVLKFCGLEMLPSIFFPGFLLIFFGPIFYNAFPSSFEKNRKIIASFTGGGSMFMFNASWPFYRLLVYSDGVEIRVMLHRFFIPHDKMEDLPEKVGFFSRGILIKSNLPDVPSNIRFMAAGPKKVVQTISGAKNELLNTKKERNQ